MSPELLTTPTALICLFFKPTGPEEGERATNQESEEEERVTNQESEERESGETSPFLKVQRSYISDCKCLILFLKLWSQNMSVNLSFKHFTEGIRIRKIMNLSIQIRIRGKSWSNSHKGQNKIIYFFLSKLVLSMKQLSTKKWNRFKHPTYFFSPLRMWIRIRVICLDTDPHNFTWIGIR